jgi:hypothetical protein
MLFLAGASSYAAPAPVLTFSNPPIFTSSANTGALTNDTTISLNQKINVDFYSTNDGGVSADRFVEIAKPTVGVKGYSEQWIDTKYTNSHHALTAFTDTASYSVNDDANNYAAGQWIQMTGTVTANQATTFDYYLQATGNFLSVVVPGLGEINPAFPSFFVSFGTTPLTKVAQTSSNAYSPTNQYSVYSYDHWYSSSIALAAGETKSFAALVYTGGDVSLANFKLNISSANYGLTDTVTTSSYTTTSYKGFVEVAALVPEPETYAMLMAGLGLLGFASRRRKSL